MKNNRRAINELEDRLDDVFLEILFTRAEEEQLQKLARRHKMSVPDYLIQAALESAQNHN